MVYAYWQMPTENDEWLKILVSATVGMFAGLLADPLRGLIQSHIETIKMEHAVLRDFSNISISATNVHEGKLPSWKFWLAVELPAFDYYWERNRGLFYTSTRLQLLRMQCELMKRLKGLVKNEQKSPDEAMVELWATIVLVVRCHDAQQWKRMMRNVRRKQPQPAAEESTARECRSGKSSFFASPEFMNRFIAKVEEFSGGRRPSTPPRTERK